MLRTDHGWVLSGVDVVDAHECNTRSAFRLAYAVGMRGAPIPDRGLDKLVIEHALAHEQRVIQQFKQLFTDEADKVVEIAMADSGDPVVRQKLTDQTLQAMDAGVAVIVRGYLSDGRLSGQASLLIRADLDAATGRPRTGLTAREQAAGLVPYEPCGIELARHAHPDAVLQLAACAAALARTGRPMPDNMHLILGKNTISTFPRLGLSALGRADRVRRPHSGRGPDLAEPDLGLRASCLRHLRVQRALREWPRTGPGPLAHR
jgi:predicted RecB family nuclease